MANRTVQLYKYTKLPSGWRYCRAAFYPNNRIKPHAVLTSDGEQTIKDGYYCLSYNRKWEPVGNDPVEAVRLLMKKRGELLTVANGGMDANREEKRNHVVWDISEYAVPRVLSPSRLPLLQVHRFVAHERILRAHCCSLPSRARDAV